MKAFRFGLMCVGFTIVAACTGARPAAAQVLFDTLEQKIGVPKGNAVQGNSLDIKITVMVNGKPVDKTVNVIGITAWVPTLRGQKETLAAFNERRTKERTAASQKKAEVIAEAINTAFDKEFKILGDKAAAGTYAQKDPLTLVDGLWGLYTIPSVPNGADKDGRYTWLKDPTKQTGPGNGPRYIPQNAPSGGSRGSMGFSRETDPFVATGIDPSGEPSLIQFGLEGVYVAQITPTSGMLDEDVLRALEKQLDDHGIPATYDPSHFELFLDNPIPDGQGLAWGNSDTGLDFFFNFNGIGPISVVPESSSAALCMIGFVGMLASRRRDSTGR